MLNDLKIMGYRFAASGWLPPHWFGPRPPDRAQRAARRGELSLEIVSHCWQYAHFLVYQLSSLVNHPPPTGLTVTMTVFYSPEDRGTQALLDFFSGCQVPRLYWNWQALREKQLFRRAIGRNRAALHTQADWIWFTDCDVVLHHGCLTSLARQLQGRQDVLVYPSVEMVTPLLPQGNPMLQYGMPALVDIDTKQFVTRTLTRATGPMQVTHGDVARKLGYCQTLTGYQQPSNHWCKAHEDRAFRWLLGSQGEPLAIEGVYRIRHAQKGRYVQNSIMSSLRGKIRKLQSRFRESNRRGNN